jgi:hypothetical protein
MIRPEACDNDAPSFARRATAEACCALRATRPRMDNNFAVAVPRGLRRSHHIKALARSGTLNGPAELLGFSTALSHRIAPLRAV